MRPSFFSGISRRILLSGVTALCAALPGQAVAGAFYLQEQSVTANGTAYAGAGAEARDASIMYYNPAGIARLKNAQITGGVSVLYARGNNTDQGSTRNIFTGVVTTIPAGGGDSDNQIPLNAIPNLYAATPVPALDDKLWLGIGFSVPFGLSTKYDDNWVGRFDSVKSDLRTYDIQPTIAFAPTDWLSIGGGLNVQHAQAKLTKAVTNVAFEGDATVKGDDWSTGYNLGVLVTPVDGTNIGFDYRSAIDHTLEGNVLITGVPGAGAFPSRNLDTGGSADLELPDIMGLSISQAVTPEWKVMGQVNYFNWSRFKNITVVTDSGTVVDTTSEDYEDTWSFAAGAEYAWSPEWTFRFGYQFDQTPTHSPNRDTRVPDGNRNNFAAGLSYNLNANLTLNAAAMYSFVQDSNVNVTRSSGQATAKVGRDDTTFAFGGLGVTYKF